MENGKINIVEYCENFKPHKKHRGMQLRTHATVGATKVKYVRSVLKDSGNPLITYNYRLPL